MKIDGRLKINNSQKKFILRKAAIKLGLKEEFAFRPKTAAQYGSGFDKALIRLAKERGSNHKKVYIDLLKALSDNKQDYNNKKQDKKGNIDPIN